MVSPLQAQSIVSPLVQASPMAASPLGLNTPSAIPVAQPQGALGASPLGLAAATTPQVATANPLGAQATTTVQPTATTQDLMGSVFQFLMMFMQMMMQFLQQMMGATNGLALDREGVQAADAGSGDAGNAGNAGTGNAGNAALGNPGFTSDDPELQEALDAAGADPEVSQLLAEARAKGYRIVMGDPSSIVGNQDVSTCAHCRAQMDAGTQVNGVTDPNSKMIVINPNAPDIKKTLAHELVHAATEGNGNSLKEEAAAEVVGRQFSARANGQTLTESQQSIADNKRRLYSGLGGDNGILGDLRSFGINLNFA